MNKLDEMWLRLAEHQAFADERGYGDAWKTMCKQRTADAACDASTAVEEVTKPEAIENEIWSAWHAADAVASRRPWEREDLTAAIAISWINKAEGKI